jgi:hypothetical protein
LKPGVDVKEKAGLPQILKRNPCGFLGAKRHRFAPSWHVGKKWIACHAIDLLKKKRVQQRLNPFMFSRVKNMASMTARPIL